METAVMQGLGVIYFVKLCWKPHSLIDVLNLAQTLMMIGSESFENYEK